jgi:hypothetical protein
MSYKIEERGFKIVPRATFFAGPNLECYAGATSMNAAAIAHGHARENMQLMLRAERFPGAFILYDPSGDAEGFMLIGDDPDALDREAVEFHDSMEATV